MLTRDKQAVNNFYRVSSAFLEHSSRPRQSPGLTYQNEPPEDGAENFIH